MGEEAGGRERGFCELNRGHVRNFVKLLAKIMAILCAHPHINANSVTEITQSNGGA